MIEPRSRSYQLTIMRMKQFGVQNMATAWQAVYMCQTKNIWKSKLDLILYQVMKKVSKQLKK